MKKLLSFIMIRSVLFLFLPNCEATDVWVEHWNDEDIDIYVMDDTIISGSSTNGQYFKVSTKEVKNGQLQKVINWSFSKYKDSMWRYETSTMDGRHTTVVIPKSTLFEYCMKILGWHYQTVTDSRGGSWYY